MASEATDELSKAKLIVNILHRPKTQNGVWVAIPANTTIRIPRKGKPVILELVPQIPCVINWSTFKVSLKAKAVGPGGREYWMQEPDVQVETKHRTPISLGKRGDIAETSDSSNSIVARLFSPNRVLMLSVKVDVQTPDGTNKTLRAQTGPYSSTGGSPRAKATAAASAVAAPSDDSGDTPPASLSSSNGPLTTTKEMENAKDNQTKDTSKAATAAAPTTVLQSASSPFVVPSNLDVQGLMRAQNYEQLSDERLKEHIESLSNACETLHHLRGTSFRWRKDSSSDTSALPRENDRVFGFIAQEVASVLPEAVEETQGGYLSVSYLSIVPVFVASLQEHLVELEKLQNASKEATATIENIRAQIARIKSDSLFLSSAASRVAIDSVKRQFHSTLTDRKVSARAHYQSSNVPNPPCTPSRGSFWKPLAIVGSAIVLALFILSLMFLGREACDPPPQAAAFGPSYNGTTTFRPTNYIANSGFEDSSTFPFAPGWDGIYQLGLYNATSMTAEENFLLSSQFDAGDIFLMMETSGSANQTVSREKLRELDFQLFEGLDASAWVYVETSTDPQTAARLTLAFYETDSVLDDTPVCLAAADANPAERVWQHVKVRLRCRSEVPPQRASVSLTTFGSARVAWDEVVLEESRTAAQDRADHIIPKTKLVDPYNWGGFPTDTWTDAGNLDCLPSCNVQFFSSDGSIMAYAKSDEIQTAVGSLGVYKWTMTGWELIVNNPLGNLGIIQCGRKSCYAPASNQIVQFTPLDRARTQLQAISVDPSVSMTTRITDPFYADPYDRYIWKISNGFLYRIELSAGRNDHMSSPLPFSGINITQNISLVAALNLDCYVGVSDIGIFRLSRLTGRWSDVSFELKTEDNAPFRLGQLLTDGRNIYAVLDRGTFLFRGDSWVLVTSHDGIRKASISGEFLIQSDFRWLLPGPVSTVFVGAPNQTFLETFADHGGQTLFAIRHSLDTHIPPRAQVYRFSSDNGRTAASPSWTELDFEIDAASYFGSNGEDDVVGAAFCTNNGQQKFVVGVNFGNPADAERLGAQSFSSTPDVAENARGHLIIGDPASRGRDVRIVRVLEQIIDLDISERALSVVAILSHTGIRVVDHDASETIWTASFETTNDIPHQVAIDETGLSAVLFRNRQNSTSFVLAIFSPSGERVLSIDVSAISIEDIAITTHDGGVVWLAGQKKVGSMLVPMLDSYSTVDGTLVYSAWSFSASEIIERGLADPARLVRLHFGADRYLYVLGELSGPKSLLRTDGFNIQSDISKSDVDELGSSLYIASVQVSSGRVRHARIGVPRFPFGFDSLSLSVAQSSISATSSGNVWLAGVTSECVRTHSLKRLNCIRMPDCSGDAFVLQLSADLDTVISWTPVSRAGQSSIHGVIAVGDDYVASFFELRPSSVVHNYFTAPSAFGSDSRLSGGNTTDVWHGIWAQTQPERDCSVQVVEEIPIFSNLDVLNVTSLTPASYGLPGVQPPGRDATARRCVPDGGAISGIIIVSLFGVLCVAVAVVLLRASSRARAFASLSKFRSRASKFFSR